MLEWRGAILQDKLTDRRNGAIVVKNNNMQVVRRYTPRLHGPCLKGPSFNSQANELAIESIELAHDGIEVQVIK